jgi:signal peptidase I
MVGDTVEVRSVEIWKRIGGIRGDVVGFQNDMVGIWCVSVDNDEII